MFRSYTNIMFLVPIEFFRKIYCNLLVLRKKRRDANFPRLKYFMLYVAEFILNTVI